MTDKQLLSRAHRELLDVLNSINQDKIHHDGDAFHELLNDVEKALAEHAMRETQRLGQEIEQEPVAWQDTRKTWVDVPLKNVLKEKRPWVGLTVDELITLEQKHIRHEDLCRAIEAKLKQKNGYAEENT